MTNFEEKEPEISDAKKSLESRMQDFSDLLKGITALDDKKKQLWLEIYENAIADRQNSFVLFRQLFDIINKKSQEYAVHGKTMTSCIERMSKANEQLIKLADLIADAQKKDEEVNPDDMFDRIKTR